MNKKIKKSQNFWQQMVALGKLMHRSFLELKINDPLRMAGATAFFTTFALPPILIIIIQLLGLFVDPRKVSYDLIERLSHVLGNTSALQIKVTLEAFRTMGQNWYVTIFGFIFLMFVATTLFAVIKNSLDQIWNIRIRPHSGFVFKLKSRLRSLIIIILAGILFFIGLFTEGVQVFLSNYVDDIWRGAGIFASRLVNELVFIVVVTIWITILFRFLTAGRPKWKLAMAGGFFTAILFTAGKIVLRFMLALSQIGTIYGASGSIVLIMLFVFYSALIFYYGGCFVKILSEAYDKPIRPVKEAFTFELLEIDPSS